MESKFPRYSEGSYAMYVKDYKQCEYCGVVTNEKNLELRSNIFPDRVTRLVCIDRQACEELKVIIEDIHAAKQGLEEPRKGSSQSPERAKSKSRR